MASRLTNQQQAFFQDEGYLIVPDIFDPIDLEPLRQELDDVINATARELQAQGQLANLHADAGFDRQLGLINVEHPEAAQACIKALTGIAGGGHKGREMFRVITHPKLVAAVESLVGPEVVGSSIYRIRPKLPGFAKGVVPWHQDSGYFEPMCDQFLILTCWVPLVDATPENGCMQILPRAHRKGVCKHHTGGNAGFLVIDDMDLPSSPAAAITAACPRGGAVFMWNTTPHCSTPNGTSEIRWSVDLRYQGSEVPNNATLLPDLAQPDVAPEFNIACYAPEADFVIQSRKHPERVTSFEAFVRRRAVFDEATRAGKLHYPQRGWQPVAAKV